MKIYIRSVVLNRVSMIGSNIDAGKACKYVHGIHRDMSDYPSVL